MDTDLDVVVVGAGAIGLSVARALAQAGRQTLVLERHERIGEETSSRNSGVIHSGIYYVPGSVKARCCVRGRELLYRYCEERSIDHRRLGKLIVAQESQVAALRELLERGRTNGVADLQWLESGEVARLEPLVRCAAGLLSPSTGIIDVHEYLLALWGDLQAAGGEVVLDCEVLGAAAHDDGFELTVRSGDEQSKFGCRWLVNAAGLSATDLLTRIDGYPPARYKHMRLAKGNYFSYTGKRPFAHLVYPMPDAAGLGIHATLDTGGATRFGPDVEWTNEHNYEVDAARAQLFYEAIRQYWPAIPPESLQPAYAGIRPKVVECGSPPDFMVEGPAQHSLPRLVSLLGVESPGLTASLALAEHVADLVSGS